MLFHEHIFVKKDVKNRAAPWHHDQAYYPVDGMKVWNIPLSNFNDCVCYFYC